MNEDCNDYKIDISLLKMSEKTIDVTHVKVNKSFDDQLLKSHTDSSTDMLWERERDNYIDMEDDSTFYATEFPSKSLSTSVLEHSSHWLDPSSTLPRTVPRNSARKNRGLNEKGWDSSDGRETSSSSPRSFLSAFTSRSSSASQSVPTYDPDKICELTGDLVEFCMELLFDFAQQENISPEGYVEQKFVHEYINMGDWEMIASIEVFYSCLEKAPILEAVMKGFRGSLGLKIYNQINDFEIIQMRVLAFLVLYESERIGGNVLETVLMRFIGQNVRRLYFYLSGQLNYDSTLTKSIVNLKGEDYFAQLIGPNVAISSKLMKKVPRAMHYMLRKAVGGHTQFKKTAKAKSKPRLAVPPNLVVPPDTPNVTEVSASTTTGCSTGATTGRVSGTKTAVRSSTSIQDSNDEIARDNSPRETASIGIYSPSNSQDMMLESIRTAEYSLENKYSSQFRFNNAYMGKVLKEPAYRGKETVTSILRERQRLKNLLVNDSFGDYESALRSMEEKQKFQEMKAAEMRDEERKRKRLLLKSQLTYHRAIAATRDIQEKKQGIGDEIRKEKEILKSTVEQERMQDLEEKKKQAKLMAEQEMERIRKATEDSFKQKQEIANGIKKQNEDLRIQSKKREKEEELQRLDTIKKIQAVHGPKPLIIAASNTYHETLLRQVYNAKNSVRLSLSKLEREQDLKNTQLKIQEYKKEKFHKLSHAQNERELWRMTNNMKRLMVREIRQPEPDSPVESDDDDQELIKIKQELQKLKQTNKPSTSSKSNDGSRRKLV